MNSRLSFPTVHASATNENWEQASSAASENAEVDVPHIWADPPPLRLHLRTGFKVPLILWFGCDDSADSLQKQHSEVHMQDRLRGMYARFSAGGDGGTIFLLQVTNNSKQSSCSQVLADVLFLSRRKNFMWVYIHKRVLLRKNGYMILGT